LRQKIPIIFWLWLSLFIYSCASQGPAVKRIDQKEWKGNYQRQPGLPAPTQSVNHDQFSDRPSPKDSGSKPKEEKKYIRLHAQVFTLREYIRGRFPGKKVVFPDELPPTERQREYRIGKEDVLSIFVWNHRDLTMEVKVRADGQISFPMVGNIQAEGLTIPELEERFKRGIERFIRSPEVTINPKEMNSLRVFMVGQLRKPSTTTTGVRPDFLLRGGNTLLDALSDVEFYADADLAATYVTRNEMIIPVNLKALLREGDLSQNIVLRPEDRIVVPGPTKEVTVLGEVITQGKYKVNIDTTLPDILSIAGGVKKDSADLYMAYMVRDRQAIPINLKRLLDWGDQSQNILMEDGDLVYIPNINEKKLHVVGEVNSPKVIYFTDPIDLTEAIAQAGGFNYYANRRQVVVIRGDIQNPQIYEVNALAMLEGKSLERFKLERGDIVYVPRTLIADWDIFVNQILPTINLIDQLDIIINRHGLIRVR
jgi:polysaccharide export outer membrane protein